MNNKVIDIIVPLYNSLDSLKRCLDSINIQTYNKLVKIYLVNDGDNNDYNDIIKEYNSLDITYLRYDTNKGPGYARQYGLDNSDSPFVMFVDSDDYLYNKHAIEFLCNNMENHDCVFSQCVVEEYNIIEMNENDLHGKLYRRSFINDHKVKFLDNLRFHEDNYFNNLLLIYNCDYVIIDLITYVYTFNRKSLTNQLGDKNIDNLDDFFYGWDKTFEFIKDTNYSEDYLSIYVYTRFLYLNRIFDILPDNYKNKGVRYYNIYNKYLNKEDLNRVYDLYDFIDYYKKNTNNC